MHSLHGGCYCGNIRLEVNLSKGPSAYQPRACDCDFCRKHGAAYVSDSRGTLKIRIVDPKLSGYFRQGDELAEMFLCTRCGVLIGALYRDSGTVYATVNARIIEGVGESGPEFGGDQPVSPKKLSGDEKVSRWKSLWFPNVQM